MKFFYTFFLFLFPMISFAISVKEDPLGLKIYITEKALEADLIVFIDQNFINSKDETLWKWVDQNPELKVRTLHSPEGAELLVFYTKARSSAIWRNKNHKLEGKLKEIGSTI